MVNKISLKKTQPMKKFILNINIPIISFFIFGLIHWFCFFYFVDYYQYNNKQSIVFEKNNFVKNNFFFSKEENKYLFINPLSIKTLSDNSIKRDKQLFKSFIKEKKFNKLFQKKIFIFGVWLDEHNSLNVIKYAFNNNVIPYHSKLSVGGIAPKNDRWLANPFNIISPQTILIKFFDAQTFTFINLLIMYTIGFIGCLLFKFKFNISNFPFFILFIFFNFNGYFVEKISAYGPHLMGYYLLPYCIYFLFLVIDSDYLQKIKQINFGILFGFFHSLIMFQGSFHLYSICMTFLIFWFIFNYKFYIFFITSLFINFSLSSIKLLPGALSFGTEGNFRYWEWGGYGSFQQLIENIIVLKHIFHYPAFSQWETSLYISFYGLIIILIFGFINYFKNYYQGNLYWKSFCFPMILILFISFKHFKHLIVPQWIPLLNSESLTARYVIFPFLILIFILVINLQDYFNKNKKIIINKILIYFVSFLTFISIMNHSRIWRMHKVDNEIMWYNKLISLDVSNRGLEKNNFIINYLYDDQIYLYAFWIGFAISIITLLFIIFWFLNLRFQYKKNNL